MKGDSHWSKLVLDPTEAACATGSRKAACAAAGNCLEEHPIRDKKPLASVFSPVVSTDKS